MENTTTKEGRHNIRCNGQARALLNWAATCAQVSVSEFVLANALASAEQAIQAKNRISLKPKEFDAFVAALDKPSRPNVAMNKALNRHATQVLR